MAFGEFRPVDQLAAELEAPGLTVSWDKVLTLVDKAPDKSALKSAYKTSYNKDLAAEVGMFSPGDPADLGLLDNKHKYLAAVILAKGSVSLGELDGATLAAMNRGSWEMVVNPDLLAKPVEDMASAMAHEARHAAQYYLIARYLAASHPNATIPELAGKMQGCNHAMLAKAKAAAPLDLDSPQGAVAHLLFVTEFAPAGSPVNPNTLWANDLRAYMERLEKLIERFRKVAEGSGPKAAEAKADVEVLQGMYERAEINYEFHRPLEVDAYMVDRLVKLGMNPGSFTKTPPGPVPVPAPPRNL